MITLVMRHTKEGQHYLFHFRPDYTDEVIDGIMDMVESDEYNLDWLDAANLSFQIACYVAAGPENPPVRRVPGQKALSTRPRIEKESGSDDGGKAGSSTS